MSKKDKTAKQRLLDYLLTLQKNGLINDKTLINKIERADIEYLKTLRKNLEEKITLLKREKTPAEKVLVNKDVLIKNLLIMQRKGWLKDPTVIAKVEAGDVKTIKEIREAIKNTQKALTTKKKVLNDLLKLQREGKLNDSSLIAKVECADEKLFENYATQLKKSDLSIEEAVKMILSDKHEVQDVLPKVAPEKRDDVLARLRDLKDEKKDEKVEKALPKGPKEDETLEERRIKGGHRTPPKGYPKSEKKYADPKNKKYPIDTEKHIRAAIAYFSKPKNYKMYKPEERKSMWRRIKSAAKKKGIEVSEDTGKVKED